MAKKEDTFIFNFDEWRKSINVLNESEENSDEPMDNGDGEDAIPYTSQEQLLTSSIQSAKEQFGASFDKVKNPMLYYPNKGGDVTFTGVIPNLRNAKFMFRYLDDSGNGCYVWVNELPLNDEILNKLNKIYGVYKNWRKELSIAEDIKPMNYQGDEDEISSEEAGSTPNSDNTNTKAQQAQDPQAKQMQQGQANESRARMRGDDLD